MVGRSVQVKEHIVEEDPLEHGIRKALNLGHTVGHAFESLALAERRPVLHGYAAVSYTHLTQMRQAVISTHGQHQTHIDT